MSIIDKINENLRELGDDTVEEALSTSLFVMRLWPKGKKPWYITLDRKATTNISKNFSEKEIRDADVSIVYGAEVIGNLNSKKLANLISFNESIEEARDFSNAHFAVKGDRMYGDTQSIYILDELGGHIRHLGFGDFGTGSPIKLPGVGNVNVEYSRADGTSIGNALEKKGFSGRPHYVDIKDTEDQGKAVKALAKIYKQKGAVEVKI